MEQPSCYNSEAELLEWLSYDLERQRELNLKLQTDNENLFLNIGSDKKNIEVNFEFSFHEVLTSLLGENYEIDTDKHVCPFIVNSKKVSYMKDVIFSYTHYNHYIDFFYATFNNNTTIFLNNCIFESIINLKEVQCFGEMRFNNSIFQHKAIFDKTTFNERVDFDSSTFANSVSFVSTNFKHEVCFNYSYFDMNVFFLNCKVEDKLSFCHIRLEKDTHFMFRDVNYDTPPINTTNYQNSKIKINDTLINCRIDFDNVYIKKIDLRGSKILDTAIFDWVRFDPDCEDWETARILKHEELKKDNIIGALRFKSIEKAKYTSYLEYKHYDLIAVIKHTKNLEEKFYLMLKKWECWWELLSLRLSWLSNNHGQNWGQALFFTILSGLLCFFIFYLPNPIPVIITGNDYIVSMDMFFPELIEYYIPTIYEPVIEYAKRTDIHFFIKLFGVLVYLLGKILVAYGTVEIVQAFRKLK